MNDSYSFTSWALLSIGLLLAFPDPALAQAPIITAITPLANTSAVAPTTPLTVSFSQPLSTGSAGALRVFSNQRGGLRSLVTPAVVSGNTLQFRPSRYAFQPGETIQYTVTRAAASNSTRLGKAQTGQFTTAVSGTGKGNFGPGTDPAADYYPAGLAMGDVDDDGDLDILIANYSPAGTVSVRLNEGSGTFSGNQNVPVGSLPISVLLGDVDGDGDLDLLTANVNDISRSSTVSVRLNNGRGTFTGTQDVPVGISPASCALGDIDGDGDLDLLVPNGGNNPGSSTVSVRLNSGNGNFSGNQEVSVGSFPSSIAVGDIDGDGDLDLVVTSDVVNVRLNDGQGSFTNSPDVSVGAHPGSVVLGDVDGNGALDLVTANLYGASVSVRLNTGTGTFTGSQDVSVGSRPTSVALGDVDSDGDLDFVAANENNGTISVRLNTSSGSFGGSQEVAMGRSTGSVTLGDVDGDGDLDLAARNGNIATISVRLNQVQVLATAPGQAATRLALFPNPTHRAATVTGAIPDAPLMVCDALGRVVFTTRLDATGTVVLVLPTGLPSGVYWVRVAGQALLLMVE